MAMQWTKLSYFIKHISVSVSLLLLCYIVNGSVGLKPGKSGSKKSHYICMEIFVWFSLLILIMADQGWYGLLDLVMVCNTYIHIPASARKYFPRLHFPIQVKPFLWISGTIDDWLIKYWSSRQLRYLAQKLFSFFSSQMNENCKSCCWDFNVWDVLILWKLLLLCENENCKVWQCHFQFVPGQGLSLSLALFDLLNSISNNVQCNTRQISWLEENNFLSLFCLILDYLQELS